MKIYLDNELDINRKIVFLKGNDSYGITESVDLMLDALKAYGYSDDTIHLAILNKCIAWGYIKDMDNMGEIE